MASVDDSQIQEVTDLKQNIRQVIKKLSPSSEPRASIESTKYTIQYDSPPNTIGSPQPTDQFVSAMS